MGTRVLEENFLNVVDCQQSSMSEELSAAIDRFEDQMARFSDEI